ncbi:MAG TPA: fumarylacetoacetase, partial [Bacteroidia bacterium]
MAHKTSWIHVDANNDFSIYNIPFGVYSDAHVQHHACSAIGDQVIDLYELCHHGYLGNFSFDNMVFKQEYLNDFIALGKDITSAVRNRIIELFTEGNSELRSNQAHVD